VRQFVYTAKDALPGKTQRNPSLEFGMQIRNVGASGVPHPGCFCERARKRKKMRNLTCTEFKHYQRGIESGPASRR
jgi:hypothetical protein